MAEAEASTTALSLRGVGMVRDGAQILRGIDWAVRTGEHWVILGANGSGKTSLVRIAALYDHPSTGSVEVLGERLGSCDVRSLRRRVGYVSAAFADLIRPDLTARDVVMCALHAALEPWWHTYDDDDRRRAGHLLEVAELGHLATRTFGTLSSGERQRVLLARARMNDPGIVLLDEPNAGLDLRGREDLVAALDRWAVDDATSDVPIVLVTHHVEEIPSTFTHAALISEGRLMAQGPIEEVVTSDLLSRSVGMAVEVRRRDGRFSAWRRREREGGDAPA